MDENRICPALIEKEGFWVCVWADEGAPIIQKLSKDVDETLKICVACLTMRNPSTRGMIWRSKKERDFINSLRDRRVTKKDI